MCLKDRHIFWSEDHFHTLEIMKTFLDDSGTYCVKANNTHGSISCRCNLVVDKGIRAYIAPEFTNSLETAQDRYGEGDELRLRTRIEAYPTVGVAWYRNKVNCSFKPRISFKPRLSCVKIFRYD